MCCAEQQNRGMGDGQYPMLIVLHSLLKPGLMLAPVAVEASFAGVTPASPILYREKGDDVEM